jgi:hypothetical protein
MANKNVHVRRIDPIATCEMKQMPNRATKNALTLRTGR